MPDTDLLDVFPLFNLEPTTTADIISAALAQHGNPDWRLSVFGDQPTAMLLRPGDQDPGSVHYMYFPSPSAQVFHHHPGARSLIAVGDVELREAPVEQRRVGLRVDREQRPAGGNVRVAGFVVGSRCSLDRHEVGLWRHGRLL